MGTRLALVVLVAVFPLLCVCGGGGGGDGGADPGPAPPEAVIDGTYFVTSYMLSYPVGGLGIGSPDHPCCGWGTAVSDGAGTLAWTIRRNVDYDLDPEIETGDLTYAVPSAGTVQILMPVGPALPYMGGHVSPDGRYAALAKLVADESPAMFLMLARRGSYSDASLSGSYVLSGFACQPDPSAIFGAVDITSPGAGSGHAAINTAGASGGAGPIAMTYSTSGDGSIDLSLAGFTGIEGGIAAGGDVVVAGGSATDGLPPGLFALVRSSTDRTLADFQGDYGIVGYRYDVSADAFVSATGTLNADGAGTFTTSLTVTDGVALGEDVPGGGTYDISSVGVLLLTNTLGEMFTGALSPDGSCAIASGAINVGRDPAFFFLHR